MIIPFQYRKLETSFIEEVIDKIVIGESVVVVGPRYSSKYWLIDKTVTYLRQEGMPAVINPRLERGQVITEFNDLQRKIYRAAIHYRTNICSWLLIEKLERQ